MRFIIFVFLLVPLFCCAQSSIRFGRTYSDTLPENFKISTNYLREHIYQGIPAAIKDELYPRSAFRFADQSAVQLSHLFTSGKVYSDWPALEIYANKVLNKIMPKELAKDTVIHAYLLKDGNSNAFMMPFGIMFVNIGLFNDLESEAALAAVMAHELAHYYLKHSLNQYVKAERGEFERVFRKTNYSKFSINNELQADSLAIVWMNQSGYGIKGISEVFKSIQRIEKQMSLLYSTDVELEESTHPFSERRLAQVDSFARVHGENLGKDFIVSQKDFWNFKKKAISEALKHLLHNFQYKSCINQAFKFHILDVDNPEYVYYLMEAIRRICYFNSDVWKNKFITDDYASVLKKQLGDKKVKMEDHLFKKLPVDILCLSDNEVNNVQAGFYWEGEPRFTTYEQAFEFFSQIGELLKEPECTLSHAIKVGFDTSAQKKLLQKYLAFEHIQFRDFATHLLNGTIQSSLQDKILCVLSDFYTTVRHGSEEIYIRNEKLTGDNNPTALIEAAVKDFPKRSALNLAELQQHHNNDYVLFRDLKSVSLRTLFAKGEKTVLYELDPRFWELMAAYQTNEIEFVDLSFYEVRKAEYGLASYKETISFDINDLLLEVKRNRYMDMRVIAVREKANAVLKVKHYGNEEKAAYTKTGKEELLDYMILNLKRKDDIAKELDEKFGGK